jgi:hypothetical protein
VVYKQAQKMSEVFETKFDLLMNPPDSESEPESESDLEDDEGLDEEEGEAAREIDLLNRRLAAGRRVSGKDSDDSHDWSSCIARWMRKPLFDTCNMEIGDDNEVVSIARGLDVDSVQVQLEEALCEDEDDSESDEESSSE